MEPEAITMEVSSVQFEAYTEQDRVNSAAIEINEAGLYNSDGTPRDHGAMSLFLGVTSDRVFCRTCKRTQDHCPGHFGIVKFARPLYASLWFTTRLIKTLRMFCFYCSHFLIDTSRLPPPSVLRKYKGHQLWSAVSAQKRVPGPCPCCGMTIQPDYERVGQTVCAKWPSVAEWESEEHELHCKAPFTTTKARQILERVDAAQVQAFVHMKGLADMMTPKSMLVPPVQGRAATVIKNVKQESDTTRQIADIVKWNEQLREADAARGPLKQEVSILKAQVDNHADGDGSGVDVETLRQTLTEKELRLAECVNQGSEAF